MRAFENKIKALEENLTNNENNEDCYKCKRDLNIFPKGIKIKTEGIRIRTKCNWYEDGKKSSKFCLNLKKIEPFKTKYVYKKLVKRKYSKICISSMKSYFLKKFLVQMRLLHII